MKDKKPYIIIAAFLIIAIVLTFISYIYIRYTARRVEDINEAWSAYRLNDDLKSMEQIDDMIVMIKDDDIRIKLNEDTYSFKAPLGRSIPETIKWGEEDIYIKFSKNVDIVFIEITKDHTVQDVFIGIYKDKSFFDKSVETAYRYLIDMGFPDLRGAL